MLSLSKYEVVALVLRQAQDEGLVWLGPRIKWVLLSRLPLRTFDLRRAELELGNFTDRIELRVGQ
jgi:hypothetical protein